MQMGYDFENERQLAGSVPRIDRFAQPWPPRGEPAGPGPAHPEWASLRARFLAIHALHRTLTTSDGATCDRGPAPSGSFALAAEAVLADCRGDRHCVNQFYSGDRKAVPGMNRPVAAPPTPGDRGMQ